MIPTYQLLNRLANIKNGVAAVLGEEHWVVIEICELANDIIAEEQADREEQEYLAAQMREHEEM